MPLVNSRRIWFAFKAGVAVAAVITTLATRWFFVDPPIPPVDASAAALIERLVYVTDEGPGTHSTVWASGFMAVDEEPKFHGGILGSAKPVVNPAMRDLVRMGVAALPDLLNHLSDSRRTGLSVGRMKFGDGSSRLGFMGIWHSDEYASRHRDAGRQPTGVNTRDRERSVDGYTVRVGDLCYVAIGQIVNRHLSVLRYQPSLCLVINSPLETPALADAVRKDWAGLTEEQHRQSLIDDAQDHSWPYAAPASLQRLYFYYPEAADPVAEKVLARPWYAFLWVRRFIEGPLVEEQDSDHWRKLIAAFSAENGPAAAEAIPAWLHGFNWQSSANNKKDWQKREATAKKILAEVYPQFDPERPQFINAATDSDQKYLIEGLSNIRSDKLDAAIARFFQSLDLKRYKDADRIYADDLAIVCMDRLIGKGMDAEFRTYCEQRIRELEQKQRGDGENQRLDALRERLRRIVPFPPRGQGNDAPQADLFGDPLPKGCVARLGTIRFRHEERVERIAISPDGKWIASATHSRTIHIWDATTGKEVHQLPHYVNALVFTPDSKTLISGGSDISFWNVATGGLQRMWKGVESEQFQALAVSADGTTLASGNYKTAAAPQEWDVSLWDVEKGKIRHTFKGFKLFVEGIALSPDGKILATASGDRSLRLWDVDKCVEVHRFPDEKNALTRVAFAPNGKTLAVGTWDGEIILWNVETKKVLHRIPAQRQPADSLHFSQDGRLLATGGVYQRPTVWDVGSGKLSARIEGFGAAWHAAFTDNDRTLVLWGDDDAIHLWDRGQGKESPLGDGHGYAIISVAISADDKMAATASFDGIYVWDLPTGKKKFHIQDEAKDGFWCVAVSPDGGTLASGGVDGFVRLWSTASGQQLKKWNSSEGQVHGIAWSPTGDTIYSCGYFMAEAWDAKTGKSKRRFGKIPPSEEMGYGHAETLSCPTVSPDGKMIAVSHHGSRRVWMTATGVEIDPDKSDVDSQPKVWNSTLGKAQPWYSLVGSTTSSLSANGKYLAVAVKGGGVRILDATTGRELRMLTGCGRPVGLTSDGRYVVSRNLTSLLVWEGLPASKE